MKIIAFEIKTSTLEKMLKKYLKSIFEKDIEYKISIYKDEKTKEPYIYINEIYVYPDKRGQGLGTRFLKEVIKFADIHKLNIALLSTLINNKKQNSFYYRQGFVRLKCKNCKYNMRRYYKRKNNEDNSI